ncbi:cell wall hydrolase [Methylobacterium sp. BTF04]|uniref:cell wall hydrolase n=1 Tax=Methylobacterium sp. BTF04 TaxID=2708300 RepID=UPI0013D5131F|nr:cell wall hydrolase [Methylobacterium sp. BTF04]NEU10593.1 cell wall hydrolase [Methylobacterium sp. BTF04]
MGIPRSAKTGLPLVLVLTTTGLGACNAPGSTGSLGGTAPRPLAMAVTDQERDCLGRAMYFESNRTDAEGLLAVGTVVMNRLEAAAFPNGGICAVVGQPRQFATGVLTKPMAEKDLKKVAEVTDAVLDGQRHPKVGRAMYFHTAGRTYPYNNMHYVAVAGGNAFYEKRKPGAPAPAALPPTAMALVAPAAPTPLAIAPAEAPVTDPVVVAIPVAVAEPVMMPAAIAPAAPPAAMPAQASTVQASTVQASVSQARIPQANVPQASAPGASLVSGLPIPTYSAH